MIAFVICLPSWLRAGSSHPPPTTPSLVALVCVGISAVASALVKYVRQPRPPISYSLRCLCSSHLYRNVLRLLLLQLLLRLLTPTLTPRPLPHAATTAQFPNFNNYIRCMQLQLTDCAGIALGPVGCGLACSSLRFCHIFCGRYLHLVRCSCSCSCSCCSCTGLATKLICANCANCLRDKFMFANFN